MPFTHTTTHTFYWNDDSLAALKAEVVALRAEGEGRMPHVGDRIAKAMERRLVALEAALAMLEEPVPEGYY